MLDKDQKKMRQIRTRTRRRTAPAPVIIHQVMRRRAGMDFAAGFAWDATAGVRRDGALAAGTRTAGSVTDSALLEVGVSTVA
jgi:hypothetical protein